MNVKETTNNGWLDLHLPTGEDVCETVKCFYKIKQSKQRYV